MNSKKSVKTLKDYLNFEHIDGNSNLLCSDGSRGAIFRLRGIDLQFKNEQELKQLEDFWRRALQLQLNESLQIVFSKRSDFFDFYQAKLKQINEAHRFGARKIAHQQMLSWFEDLETPVSRRFTSRITITYWQKAVGKAVTESQFLSRLSRLEASLRYSGLCPERLNKNQIEKLISDTAVGPNQLASTRSLPEVEIFPRRLKINGESVHSFYLKRLPEKCSEIGMIEAIKNLPFSFDIGVSIQSDTDHSLKKKLNRKKKLLMAILLGRNGRDPEKESQLEEIDDVLRRLNNQSDSLQKMDLCICYRVPFDGGELLSDKIASELLGLEGEMGFLEFEETNLCSFDAFLMCLPGSKSSAIQPHTILSSNVVHFLPFAEDKVGDSDAPTIFFPTRFGFQYHINPTSKRFANFNWLVAGTSGSGKSFFVNSLLSQMSIINPQLFIVDIGGSYKRLTEFLGGTYIRLSPNSAIHLSPLFSPRSEDPHEERRRRQQIQMLFSELCRYEEVPITLGEQRLLSAQVERMLNAVEKIDHPIAFVRDQFKKCRDEKAERLAFLLDRWAFPSFFGDFLDHPHITELDSDIICFDLKGTEEFPDLARVVQLIISASLWARVRRSKNKFSMIVLDEVAFSLLRWQPDFVEELVSTIRKFFGGVTIVVQDLEKITQSIAGSSILQNTQFKALLQQRGHPENLRKPLGLDSIDIRALHSLRRVTGSFSEIYLINDTERNILNYRPNLFEYYLSTTNSQEVIYLEEALKKYNGSFQQRFTKFIKSEIDHAA